MSYSCRNGIEHKRDEWCRQRLTEEESAQLRALLKKIAACHIPHSSSWYSGGECPACWAEDFYGNDDDPGRALWVDNNEDAIMAGRAALAKSSP